MIGRFEVGVGGMNMGGSVLKLAVDNVSFLIIPLVHRE